MFDSFTIPLGAGLNLRDLPEELGEGEAVVLQNLVASGQGRLSPRRAFRQHLSGLAGDVIAVVPFPVGEYSSGRKRGGVVLTYSGGTTRLYDVDVAGLNPGPAQTLWSGGSAAPRISAARLGWTLFICDEGRAAGLTLYVPGRSPALYQPTFKFTDDADKPPAAMRPRIVAQHANMIFTAGYGSEVSPDRPEAVRFSYLGLIADEQGAYDAGADEASEGLFDAEDHFALTEAGVPIVGMATAAGRLIICTPHGIHQLYGTDRNSFQATGLDNERGLVSAAAMVEAVGAVWGWSARHGPWVFDGQMRDLSPKLAPRLGSVGHDRMFAVHVAEAREVRWYYAENNSGFPNRCFAFNYEEGEWREHPLPFPVICAGRVSPYWSVDLTDEDGGGGTPPGGGGNPLPTGPAAAPAFLHHLNITGNSALSRWSNGDTSPGIETEIERQQSGGAWALVATLVRGAGEYRHTGLLGATFYNVRVRHKRSGMYSSYATGAFTTLAAGSPPNPPKFLSATDSPTPESASVLVTFQLGTPNVSTHIFRSTDGANWVGAGSTAPGVTMFRDSNVTPYQDYYYRARSINEYGESGFSNADSVYPTPRMV